MFDVIDLSRCRTHVLSRFEGLVSRVREGAVSDAGGARMSIVTMEEAYGLARTAIAETIRFDAANAARYVAQFPEILGMPLVGETVSDSVSHGLQRAVFGRLEETLREAVVAQYDDYLAYDLDVAVSNGLSMYEKYLVNDPFGRLRVRPEKVLSYLCDVQADAEPELFKKLKGQIDGLASELKTKPLDARHVARALREASQFCVLAISAETTLRLERPRLATPMSIAV